MVYSAYTIPVPPSIDPNTNIWGSAPNPEVYRFGFPREWHWLTTIVLDILEDYAAKMVVVSFWSL